VKRVLPLLLLLGCAAEAPPVAGPPPAISVRLARFEAEEGVSIAVAGPWVLSNPDTGEELETGTDLRRRVPVRNAHLPRPLRISPGNGRITVEGRRYRGDLVLRANGSGTLVVLLTDLESYLPGVLAGEMGSRFTPAALRAQAVMARTYALSRMRESDPDRPWHVADDTRDQVFLGETTDPALLAAVERTRGMVLTWRSAPLPGYYHSTCGGHTASAAEVFGEPDLPPMVGVPCGYCIASPRFRWSPPIRWTLADLKRLLSLPAPPESVEITGRRPDGRVSAVRFLCPEPVEFTGEKLRFRLGPKHLRSTLIHRITIEGEQVVFEGGGAGHGVGLCQWGAEGMARAGASAADILAHYAPGAVLGRIY